VPVASATKNIIGMCCVRYSWVAKYFNQFLHGNAAWKASAVKIVISKSPRNYLRRLMAVGSGGKDILRKWVRVKMEEDAYQCVVLSRLHTSKYITAVIKIVNFWRSPILLLGHTHWFTLHFSLFRFHFRRRLLSSSLSIFIPFDSHRINL
jgi:hypothetical protein